MQPDHSTQRTGGGGAPADDAALLEASLANAATRCEDLTPGVYARFFARRPAAAALFTVPDPSQPPLGCGQMLFEIISLLTDAAAGLGHVRPYMHQLAVDHVGFKVTDPSLYRDLLLALTDELESLLGADWTDLYATAWRRQCDELLEGVHLAAVSGFS